MLKESNTIMKYLKDNKGGVALILALFLLVVIASFVAILTSKTRAALIQANNFKNAAKASCLARAGLHRALYELKFHPTSGHAAAAGSAINAYDASVEDWYFDYGNDINVDLVDSNNSSFGGLYSSHTHITEDIDTKSSIKLRVIDAASLININMADETGLRALLLNLKDGALAAGDVSAILASRPSGGYKRISDLKEHVSDTAYDEISPYVTVHSFMDAKLTKEDSGHYVTISNDPADGELRAPINMNTADYEVLRAVFRGLDVAISNTEADALAQRISTRANTNPFTSWSEFNTYLDSIRNAVFSSPTPDSEIIKIAVNPNRPKDAAYTTDLCFASEGYFEIQALGQVTNPFGAIVASRELKTSAKIYDVMRFSTRDDLIGRPQGIGNIIIDDDGDGAPNILDTSYSNPTDLLSFVGHYLKPGFRNTTWYDSTPIDPDDDLGLAYADDYTIIPGSIKLGFWDNFDESPEESGLMWLIKSSHSATAEDCMQDVGATSYWPSGSSPATDADNELWHDFGSINPPEDDTFTYNGVTEISPFLEVNTYDDFIAFCLGDFYNRWDPANMNINTYRRWGYDMYLRIFNSEGPRTIATHAGVVQGRDGFEVPGRNFQDVGYVIFRADWSRDANRRTSLLALSTLGNFYAAENRYALYAPQLVWGYDMNGTNFIEAGPEAIRDVSSLYPPELYIPAPPEAPMINAISQPFAFNNGWDPQTPPLPTAPNYRDRLNSIFMLKPSPWDIPSYLEGSESYPQFPLTTGLPIRDKTYRIISKGDNALLQMTRQGASYVTMFANQSLPHQSGSIALYGKASHPAWDDLRIIGNSGEYTTAMFTPGTIANNNDILWGTFAWTETFDQSAASTPRLDMRLLFTQGNPPNAGDRYDYSLAFNNHGEGGPIISGGNAIQAPYNQARVYINMGLSDVCPGNTKAPDIPVFEDATITFLPETVIYYVQQA